MELRGISELDLNGILFVHFPDEVPLDECRDQLELLVYEAWEEENKGLADDERSELCLSRYLINIALTIKESREIRKMDPETRKRCVEWAWEDRRKRLSHRIDKPKGVLVK